MLHTLAVLRSTLLALLSATACAAQDPPAAQEPTKPARFTIPFRGTTPAQWRLIWTEAPQTAVTVAWSTAEEGETHRVYFDTESRRGELSRYHSVRDCYASERHRIERGELYYHHARLDGLRPSTTYYLVMASDGEVSREIHFRTAPADDRVFSILQGGDSRSDRATRRQMNALIARLAEQDDTILALAHAGDYVFNGLSLLQWSHWMSDFELTVTREGRMLPIVPARGNHEAFGPLFDEVFASPGGAAKNYYATELSPSVLLITLNTEIAAGGNQARFLAGALESWPNVRWKLAQYHRPIFPSVKLPARVKPHWQPLFDQFGIDLVCEADGHALKRTVPIRGDRRDRRGVVYIGEGGLGVKQRTPAKERWYLQRPGFAKSAHHVWKLRFEPERLDLTAITLTGIADRHWLLPRVERAGR